MHSVVFFIFLVANIGGSLTPLGDPPLFLGYLKGVSFFWTTTNLFVKTCFMSLALLGIYFVLDTVLYGREGRPQPPHDPNKVEEKLGLDGSINLLFLLGIVLCVLVSGMIDLGEAINIHGVGIDGQNLLRDILLLCLAGLSWKFTTRQCRELNGFSWAPIEEVAKLFLGIFLSMIPALAILRAGTDGALAGVGAVLGFVPQMLVLFLMLAILEDIGYMARIAFIMDRIFRKFGLSGKSFIPMLVGTGCGVPGVMASRTIENERDRRMTIMTTCFIPCGAKMPIIGLIAGAMFGGSSLVAVSAYFIGMAAIICSGIILKKTKAFAGDPAPFVMELPAYHVPAWGNVFRATWERGWSFIKRAGTVILAATIILWFLQGFGFENGAFTMVEDQDNSILAIVASAISWIFIPQGFGNWRATVASISGLIAKENVVGTFGVLYHYADELSDNGDEIWPEVAASFTAISAYSFMIFNLLCAPCFAAMGAIKREMNNGKWTAIAIGYMCALAYCAALVVYQIGGLITGEVGFNFFTIVAIVIFAAFLYLMFRPNKYVGDNEVKIDVSKIK